MGGGPGVVVSTAAFRGSVPGLGGLKETKMFLPHPRVKLSSVGSLRDREVACSASDRQGSNFESCVWRTVSSHSSHHPQEVFPPQFSLYVHKGGIKPDSFNFIWEQIFANIVRLFESLAKSLHYAPPPHLWPPPQQTRAMPCANLTFIWTCLADSALLCKGFQRLANIIQASDDFFVLDQKLNLMREGWKVNVEDNFFLK